MIIDRITTDSIGKPSGVAPLDTEGFIPLELIPPTLKEVDFFNTFQELPIVGMPNRLYLLNSTQEMFVWDGSLYKPIVLEPIQSVPKLSTPRNIGIRGDALWDVDFDGSSDVNNNLTLTPSGVTPGTYTKVEVDQKGRVIRGTYLETSDLPIIDGGNF
jgi:hypothetical protein